MMASSSTRIGVVALLATIPIHACTVESPPPAVTVQDSAGIRIVELGSTAEAGSILSFPLDPSWTPDPTLEFGDLIDVRPGPDGGFVLVDGLSTTVAVLDRDGSVRAQFGTEGQGPGEFNPAGLSTVMVTDSTLLIPDLMQQRVSEFTPDGAFLGEAFFPLPAAHIVDWSRTSDGDRIFRLLAKDGDRILRSRNATGGPPLDTLFAFPPYEVEVNLLLPPTALWTVMADGGIVVGRSNSSELRRFTTAQSSPTAVPEWIVRIDTEETAVTDAERDHLQSLVLESMGTDKQVEYSSEDIAKIMSTVSFPTHRPLLSALRAAPDGTLWVRRVKEIRSMDRSALAVGKAAGFGGSEWDVLEADGTYRARVRLPENFEPTTWVARDDGGVWIYGTHSDGLGIQTPARVQISW